MKKICLILLTFSMLFCACSKEDDDYIKLSSQETKQYCEAIAGSYEAKGYTFLVAHKDFYNSDVIEKTLVLMTYLSMLMLKTTQCSFGIFH